MHITGSHKVAMALVECPYCHAVVGSPCYDRAEPGRVRKAAHPSRYAAEQRRHEAEAGRREREAREEEMRRWPDGSPDKWEPMTWGRIVRQGVTTWVFSGVEPGAYPPRWEDARIEERAASFRWEVGADEWTYDAGYARSLAVAKRRAEQAFRECWPELVAEFEDAEAKRAALMLAEC